MDSFKDQYPRLRHSECIGSMPQHTIIMHTGSYKIGSTSIEHFWGWSGNAVCLSHSHLNLHRRLQYWWVTHKTLPLEPWNLNFFKFSLKKAFYVCGTLLITCTKNILLAYKSKLPVLIVEATSVNVNNLNWLTYYLLVSGDKTWSVLPFSPFYFCQFRVVSFLTEPFMLLLWILIEVVGQRTTTLRAAWIEIEWQRPPDFLYCAIECDAAHSKNPPFQMALHQDISHKIWQVIAWSV